MKYFTKKELIEAISETLEGYEGCYCDLHNEVFNTDYHFIYTDEATEALEEYGTFKAIDEVVNYEKENFGEVNTEINPCAVANMLWFIKGEEVIGELFDYAGFDWNEEATEETNKKLADMLSEL